jgi:copper(I)-binding protein
MSRLVATIVAAVALGACSSWEPPLVVSDLEVTAPLPGSGASAGYFRLTNNTDAMIEISHVASAEFRSVEMHETVIDDGIARMRRLAGLSIAPGETVVFERGGKHLMLTGPVAGLETVTLSFFSGDSLLLAAGTRIDGDD